MHTATKQAYGETIFYDPNEAALDGGDFLRDAARFIEGPAEEERRYVLVLQLSSEGQRRLRSWSAGEIGRRYAIFVAGQLRVIESIWEPIEATNYFLGGYTKEEAERILELLKTTATPQSQPKREADSKHPPH